MLAFALLHMTLKKKREELMRSKLFRVANSSELNWSCLLLIAKNRSDKIFKNMSKISDLFNYIPFFFYKRGGFLYLM